MSKILSAIRTFANPSGEADGTLPDRRPRLGSSWFFALLVGLFAVQACTGMLFWLLTDTFQEGFRHTAIGVHVRLGYLFALLFLVLLKSHIRSLFGLWAGRLLIVLFFALAYVLSLIHMPIWPVFFSLPVAMYLLLRLFFSSPRAQVESRPALSGAVAATAWWAFLLYSVVFHFIKEEFYIRYPVAHVVLMMVAVDTLLFHRIRMVAREALAGSSFRRRFVFAAALVAVALAFVAARGNRVMEILQPDPDQLSLSLPVAYDLTDVAVGKPLVPDPRPLFERSETCRAVGCHDGIYRQWSISSHRYAAMTKPYRKMIELVYAELGPDKTLFCSKCHTPLLAMLGLADDPNDRSLDVYRMEGISCQYCHVIEQPAKSRANGDYLLRFQASHYYGYKIQDDQGLLLKQDYIARDLSRHRRVYPVRDPSQEEYCIGCHRVVMPREFVGDRTLILGDVHTPYIHSQPAAEGISCSECHMPLGAYWGDDPRHARPDHRMLGANNAMDRMIRAPFEAEPDLNELDRATVQYLDGTYRVPEYEVDYLYLISNRKHEAYKYYLKDIKKISVYLTTPERIAAGSDLIINVTVANRTGAHKVPSGPIDLNQYWIELIVSSAGKEVLYQSGVIDANHRLPEGAILFGGVPLDQNGLPVQKHRFWETHSVGEARSIGVDKATSHRYLVPLPWQLEGPITVHASFCYRRYGQQMADWLFDQDGTTFPVYRYDTTSKTIEVTP